MKKKRTVGTALCAVVMIAAFAGTAWAAGSGEKSASSGPVNVSYWAIWSPSDAGGGGKYFPDVISKFNAANPGIVVTMYGQGGYDGVGEKLEAAIIAKNTPVIAQIEESFIARFGVKAADLTKYISKATIDNYQPGLLRSSYDKGVLKAVPINRSTPILFLNADLLAKAGLDPKGPKTWDELVLFADKIHAMDPSVYGFTGYWDSDAWYWESALYSFGGEVLNADSTKVAFNNEAGWKIVDMWQKMIKSGSMLNSYGGQETGSDYMAAKFAEGKVGMMLDSIGSLAQHVRNNPYPFKVNVCFQPAGTKYAEVSGGANLIIMNDATEAQKKAAGKFLEYIAQDSVAAGFAMYSGYFPITKSALLTPEYQKLFQDYPQYKVAMDQIQYIHSRPWHKNWREMYIAILEELEAALINPNSDAQALIATAAERCQKIVDENK